METYLYFCFEVWTYQEFTDRSLMIVRPVSVLEAGIAAAPSKATLCTNKSVFRH